MKEAKSAQKDAYALLLGAIDLGEFKPGDRLVESDLADLLFGDPFQLIEAAVLDGLRGIRRDLPAPPAHTMWMTRSTTSAAALARRIRPFGLRSLGKMKFAAANAPTCTTEMAPAVPSDTP